MDDRKYDDGYLFSVIHKRLNMMATMATKDYTVILYVFVDSMEARVLNQQR